MMLKEISFSEMGAGRQKARLRPRHGFGRWWSKRMEEMGKFYTSLSFQFSPFFHPFRFSPPPFPCFYHPLLLSFPFPPLPLEVDPLNTAGWSGESDFDKD